MTNTLTNWNQIKEASVWNRGTVEPATVQEVKDGLNEVKFISPKVASETLQLVQNWTLTSLTKTDNGSSAWYSAVQQINALTIWEFSAKLSWSSSFDATIQLEVSDDWVSGWTILYTYVLGVGENDSNIFVTSPWKYYRVFVDAPASTTGTGKLEYTI